MQRHRLDTIGRCLLAGLAVAVIGFGPDRASAEAMAADATTAMFDRQGQPVGSVTLTALPRGTLLHARLENLPPGVHAFHVHERGVCEPPFDSAGGHFNPDDAAHGMLSPEGPHAGDLPNIHVPDSGRLEIEIFSGFLLTETLLANPDGAAIVVHEGPDDYQSQPSGAAGGRIACGVIEATS